MSEQLVNSISALTVNECTSEPEDVSHNLNGDQRKCNPWKPIVTPVLESEAWPEPSVVGDHKRSYSLRQPEEKPKRNLKWRNFEVEQPSAFSRGRPRGRAFSHQYATNIQFRRGNFRGRGDVRTRNGNGYTPWHYGSRFSTTRPLDTRDPGFGTNYKSHALGNGSNDSDLHQDNSGAIMDASVSTVETTAVVHDPLLPSKSIDSLVHRAENPHEYEAGPIGRARRSYIRQHQTDQTAPIPSFQPVISIDQPLAYVFPTVPAVAQAIWGAPVQINTVDPSDLSRQVTVPNTILSASQPDQSHSVMPGFVPILDPHITATSAREFPKKSVNPEVVDVTELLSFINQEGWEGTVFPSSLRSHPTISNIIPGAMVSNNSVDQSGPDDHKPEDVIIVNNLYFFVPRNANRTKFLKFSSKLDCIQHHVEYYFSEYNLARDLHLNSILEEYIGTCPIPVLRQFNRLKWVSTTDSELIEAVKRSDVVRLTYVEDIPNGVQPTSRINLPGSNLIGSYRPDISAINSPSSNPPSTDPSSLEVNLSLPTQSAEKSNCDSVVSSPSPPMPESIPPYNSFSVPVSSCTNVPGFPRSDVHGYMYSPSNQQLFYQSLLYPSHTTAFLSSLPTQNYISPQPLSVLPTADSLAPFMPTLCRVVPPGNPTQTIGNPVPFNPPVNPAVFFQFLPATQRNQTCYIPIPSATSNVSQPISSTNGLWIPSVPLVPFSGNPTHNMVKSMASVNPAQNVFTRPTLYMQFQTQPNQGPGTPKSTNQSHPVPVVTSETIPNIHSSN